ncbi:golgi-associated plant pathogenesis-related protein 1 [Trichonephila clavipes]|nr:golgi-associated plant pathogenesis-related protein 1 [Trichonephila clavipes]
MPPPNRSSRQHFVSSQFQLGDRELLMEPSCLAKTSDSRLLSMFLVILGRHIYIRGNGYEPPEFAESEFVVDCLHWHNVFREKHDVPPLKLNNQLCTQAQFWANNLAHTNTFSHRNLRDIGENLFSKWSYIPDFDITEKLVNVLEETKQMRGVSIITGCNKKGWTDEADRTHLVPPLLVMTGELWTWQ